MSETRCGRESHTRPKGPLGPPVVSETSWWQDVVEKASTQQKAEPPGLWLIIRRTRKTTLMAIKVGSMYYSSVQSLTPSHSKTLSNPFRTLTIKWEVHIFLKKSSLVVYHCVVWSIHHIYVYKHIYHMTIQQKENKKSFAYQSFYNKQEQKHWLHDPNQGALNRE